ncbi:putative amino acid racemase [Litoreibacter ponti]|uniref:Putative amino acid racemase n=1 Tax=Litoreibacter ponti TaxID=1510457 RepID=A0A2T6BIX0_9RHOB|nr:alanine racemase [Litoreibacter ponti]PTX56004.1 putative amino acid racemase [Litoreibacter ponti]
MSSPRIEVDLEKVRKNTRTLARRLNVQGMTVTAVSKAVCGDPMIAQAMIDGGAAGLAEARLSNVRRLRAAGLTCAITLIRTPLLSQAAEVVRLCDASYNTESVIIAALAAAALGEDRVHDIILMVEMGDLREGVMPEDLSALAQRVMDMPGVALKGIGANFACLSGVAPNASQMRALSALANDTEALCGPFLQTVSGGNSASLPWAFGKTARGRINDLRVGEAILLGVDPVSGDQIGGLYRDAFALFAEVIETDEKPTRSQPCLIETGYAKPRLVSNIAPETRVILAMGLQDTDIHRLSMPAGYTLVGATSDHLVISTARAAPRVGSELKFHMNYSALMRAAAAPDGDIVAHIRRPPSDNTRDPSAPRHLAMV